MLFFVTKDIVLLPTIAAATVARAKHPLKVFDDLRHQLAANRPQFYLDFASGPFYGDNRRAAKASEAVIWNWWRQGIMGSAKAHYNEPERSRKLT